MGSWSGWIWDAAQKNHYCYLLDDDNQPLIPYQYMWATPSSENTPAPSNSLSARRDSQQIAGMANEDDLEPEMEYFRFRRVKRRSCLHFFSVGKVIQTEWTEHVDTTSQAARDSIVLSDQSIREGAAEYTEIRNFVVVRTFDGFSECLPIRTHRRRKSDGESRYGVNIAHWGVIYTGNMPTLAPGEAFYKQPIRVDSPYPNDLPDASRINYSKVYNIHHSSRVFAIGQVVPENAHLLEIYHGMTRYRPEEFGQ